VVEVRSVVNEVWAYVHRAEANARLQLDLDEGRLSPS